MQISQQTNSRCPACCVCCMPFRQIKISHIVLIRKLANLVHPQSKCSHVILGRVVWCFLFGFYLVLFCQLLAPRPLEIIFSSLFAKTSILISESRIAPHILVFSRSLAHLIPYFASMEILPVYHEKRAPRPTIGTNDWPHLKYIRSLSKSGRIVLISTLIRQQLFSPK